MSQVRKETIECPHCHLEGEYDPLDISQCGLRP